MKKILLVSFCLIFLLGCTSTSFVKVNPEETWAIYSVSANKFYRFRGFDENGAGIIQDIMMAGSYEENPVAYGYTKDFLNYAMIDLKSLFIDKKITLIPNETVVTAKLYGQIKEDSVLLGDKRITVDNLKYFNPNNEKIPYALAHEIKADKFLCLDFGFYKDVEKGDYNSGDLIPIVSLDVRLYDKAGKILLKKEFYAEPSTYIVLENGRYDEQAFYKLFYPMITQAVKLFGETLQ